MARPDLLFAHPWVHPRLNLVICVALAVFQDLHGVFHVDAMLQRFAAALAAPTGGVVLLCQPPLSKMRTNHIKRYSDLGNRTTKTWISYFSQP
jgi:hypothetical protein